MEEGGQVATGPGDHRKNFLKCIGKLFEVFSKRNDVIQLLFLECDSGCPVETDVRGARAESGSPATAVMRAGDDSVSHWAGGTADGQKGCHSR